MTRYELRDSMRGRTVRGLAAELHVSKTTVSDWLSGKHRVPYSVELAIAHLNE